MNGPQGSGLQGKRVIITGAASGIGRAAALLFAERGAQLTLGDWNGEGLSATAEAVRANGGKVAALAGDASDPAYVTALVEACINQLGVPDVFWANAGIGGGKPLLEETVADWERILRVNLIGPVLAIQTVAPHMARAGKGAIILTASVAGLRSGAGSSAYSASKAGIVSLTQTAACQLATQGIRVNAICPGLIETGMTKGIFDFARSSGKEGKLGKHNPMQRPAQPHEIASVAAFLASDDASFMTGQALPVDGGMTATHPFTPGRII